MQQPVFSLTISSPTNIALIKYWGKRDAKINLPINSSVSVTLNQRDLRTVTTVSASRSFSRDRLWLNGEEEDVNASRRVLAVFREVRARAGDLRDPKTGQVLVRKDEWDGLRVWVVSENNFPTAAGLASSAAGYAALTFALSKLYGLPDSLADELSCIARMGSGSACRSLAGGFVAWDMGQRADGVDSRARQVADEAHWPELQVLVLVVSDTKKTVSSTAGMQTSVDTSPLLAHRAAAVVPGRLAEMEAAYQSRDFGKVAELMMRDSNQFHATCLDTYPPVFYMNDASRAIVRMVHALNEAAGETVCGYTFDAGPNAVLLTLKRHLPTVLEEPPSTRECRPCHGRRPCRRRPCRHRPCRRRRLRRTGRTTLAGWGSLPVRAPNASPVPRDKQSVSVTHLLAMGGGRAHTHTHAAHDWLGSRHEARCHRP